MDKDFIRAFAKGEDLETVRKRLCDIEYRRHTSYIDSIMKDYRDADMIKRGLQEDKDSYTYRIASEFLKDAQNAEDQKSDELKNYEASRQRIEEEYLKAQREHTETIRQETDLKRRKIAIEESNLKKRFT